MKFPEIVLVALVDEPADAAGLIDTVVLPRETDKDVDLLFIVFAYRYTSIDFKCKVLGTDENCELGIVNV